MTTPLVSIVVAAYQAERFLADAIRSALGQTHDRVEVLVVDDGSTDRTGAVADEWAAEDRRVRVVHQPNGGPSAARNAGLRLATGDLLCFLDADDVLLPDKLRLQCRFLDLFPGCDLVYSDYYVGDSQLTPTFLVSARPPPIPMRELLAYRNWFGIMSPLLRARLVEKVGGFDERLRGAEDWDFWVRASGCGTFSYLPGPVAVYRSHAAQAHHEGERMLQAQREAIAKHYAPGSVEWRIVRAARAWKEAKLRWGERRYAGVLASVCRSAWHARSHRVLLNVVSLTSRYR